MVWNWSLCSLAVGFFVSGCAGVDISSKEEIGKQLGMVIGGVAGASAPVNKKYRDFAITGGAIGGMLLGGYLGKNLDEQDREKMTAAAQEALASGKKQSWSSSAKKTYGTAEIIANSKEAPSECKTVRSTVSLPDGKQSSQNEVACPDGNGWKFL